ncbi:hypothetical protein V3C99_018239, partial [Haemonchus contortus]
CICVCVYVYVCMRDRKFMTPGSVDLEMVGVREVGWEHPWQVSGPDCAQGAGHARWRFWTANS